MALQKIIQHSTGAFSSYWKIRNLNLDYAVNTGSITIDGFVSEETRLENKIPLDTKLINIQENQFTDYFSVSSLDSQNINPVKSGYNFLKTTDTFVGSEDV